MKKNTKKLVKEVQDEKEIILEKGLNEAWERGFKYGVAWLLKQTSRSKEDEKQIEEILDSFEEEELLKGIKPIYYSLED